MEDLRKLDTDPGISSRHPDSPKVKQKLPSPLNLPRSKSSVEIEADSRNKLEEIKEEKLLNTFEEPDKAQNSEIRDVNVGVKLLSYLEKSKIKEDMRRLITGKILQLRTFIELDYFDHRLKVKTLIGENNIPEMDLPNARQKSKTLDFECSSVNIVNTLLINIKTCDTEFPDLVLLRKTCLDFLVYLSKTEPNIYYASEEQMKRSQDKVSLCKSIVFICEVYNKNLVWKEYLEGDWGDVSLINSRLHPN